MKKSLVLLIIVLSLAWSSKGQGILDQEESTSDYGIGHSLGLTILGDGLGLMYRYTFQSENQLGGYLGYSPLVLNDGLTITFFSGFLIKPEFNIYIGYSNKEKQRRYGIKSKLKKKYISIKQGFGYMAGPYQNEQLRFWRSSTTLSYHQQRFFRPHQNRSTGFDIGIRFDYYGSLDVEIINSPVSVFIRWDWAWFFQKN